ncbi:acyltransferase family protein [Arthrobacter sp. UM1]|uniref:acyltransferase family protein n=1 Tax=Arthrobacter sp. UM1 TaxID=2766776 RepID=UPI001CF67602|nr:acyltransferase family protein [Arthrobacter sp. UM1]MCB4208144.1 acyltransferase [Arthrobacter sp. UM1]
MSTVPRFRRLQARPDDARAEQRHAEHGPAEPRRTSLGRRFIVLDVLRAAAVLLVIVYHLLPGSLPAGYLGVDLFFVLSGFLITRGLVGRASAQRLEAREGTRVSARRFLGDFYVKRLRRLFPAFALMLVTVCSLSLAAPPDVRVHLGRQVLGALTSTANWVQLAAGSSYFDAGTPQLLKHMWSLAVEEQFYLVWPAVVLLAVAGAARLARPGVRLRTRLATGSLAAAVASAAGMAVVYAATGDTNQAYLNSLTHASGLLLGAYVACMPIITRTSPVRRALAFAGAICVAVLCLILLPDTSAASQYGGIFAFSLAVAVLVRIGTTGALGGASAHQAWFVPVRWVADRSYALYLWHWPLMVLATAWIPDPNGGAVEPGILWGRAALAGIPAFVLAEVSYRLVEAPVLARGFRGAWARLGSAVRPQGRAWARPRGWAWARPQGRAWARPVAAGAALLLAGATAFAAFTAPAKTQEQASLEALQSKAQRGSNQEGSGPQGHGPAVRPGAGDHVADTADASGIDSSQVTFIGDSVTVAASDTIAKAYPKSRIEASVGQQMWTAADRISRLREQGRLGSTVVVALGTNGTFTDRNLEKTVEAGGPETRFVFVTAYGQKEWIPDANARLRAYAKAHPKKAAIADWEKAAPQAHDMAADGVHPGPQGDRIWVRTVTRAIKDVNRTD